MKHALTALPLLAALLCPAPASGQQVGQVRRGDIDQSAWVTGTPLRVASAKLRAKRASVALRTMRPAIGEVMRAVTSSS